MDRPIPSGWIKLSTVIGLANTEQEVLALRQQINDSHDASIMSLAGPFNDHVNFKDHVPSCALLVRHDMEDGTYWHSISMSSDGVDYIIYDHVPQRSADSLKRQFPFLDKGEYRRAKLQEANANLGLDQGAEHYVDLFGEGLKERSPTVVRDKRKSRHAQSS